MDNLLSFLLASIMGAFLLIYLRKKIGVHLGPKDLTSEISKQIHDETPLWKHGWHDFEVRNGDLLQMNRTTRRLLAPLLFLVLSTGCGKTRSDSEAMRDAIRQHLIDLKTLNLTAMDFDIDKISLEDSQAHVQVTFRPKTGAPPGVGMQVVYVLEKRGSGWSFVKTESVGGMISHPAQGANPHMQPASSGTFGNMPNFRDLIPPSTAEPSTSLPPGHPPINPDAIGKSQEPLKPH